MQDPHWHAAMSAKYNALIQNGTLEFFPPAPHFNVISNKWIFQKKQNPDGMVQCYKVMLVAKGFH